jgi:ferredoxin
MGMAGIEPRSYTMSKNYQVEIHYDGGVSTIAVAENETILAAADKAGIHLPNSCNAGVCTTCAGKIISGQVDQSGGMGVSPDLQAQGYVLLCVAYPRSDLKIATEKEDELYHLQFGQFQKN